MYFSVTYGTFVLVKYICRYMHSPLIFNGVQVTQNAFYLSCFGGVPLAPIAFLF